MNRPTVSVIIVNYNTGYLLNEALGALYDASERLIVDTIIVDNASKDDSIAFIQREFQYCKLIANTENVGFGRANNQAMSQATGDYVLLLNTDAFVTDSTLDETVAYMQDHPECGILGVKLAGRDGQLQPSARYFPTPWNMFIQRSGLSTIFRSTRLVDNQNWDHQSVLKCDWVPGCYYLIRKAVIDQVGLFDPRYFLYFEEVDHCFAAKKAGWEVVSYPYTTVVHIGGESAKSDGAITQSGRQLEALQVESELLYFRKNLGATAMVADVLLNSLADAILALKHLFRRRGFPGLAALARHTGLVWMLLYKTQWGKRPTR
jgi:N-acetylglucosaminyl-diphospho-decaprenol L-rhamnosyltransferase